MKKIKKIIKEHLSGCVLIWEKLKCRYYSNLNPKKYPEVLKKWYKRNTKETLDLENPKNYTQKIQWLKLYDSTKLKADLSDKYKVRDWIKKKIGNEYLVPLLGCYKDANEIDFGLLPNRFVIKMNHGSGWNIIVKDKNKINSKRIIKKLNSWRKLNYAFNSGLELHYGLIEPCIIIEEYMENLDGQLNDYKFLCFNGKPYYCWVDIDRYHKHKRNVYDMNWNLQPWNQYFYENSSIPIEKPKNFEKMVELATILCEGFKHVRIDFYNIEGKIIFGEMTFTNGSGKELITIPEVNVELGKLIDIKK